ncbi:chromate efflux transporter [Epibacterium sp. MM17-32]|uniref:chromate efflux transporter n=1 Tax=Epibacterium sp. MM17-32 TaxID=2917734 RepID=UPI001EF625FA|nr:chromate efflux transporter [Epibacterium sp. MM17-32]MCG7626338.1 chromate efflux transporter [Epibacterium sp. MM17-32]
MPDDARSTEPCPSWTRLFHCFGLIGLLSFGGPAAQIALMHRELVDRHGWLNEDQFLRGLSFCMLLPGPEAMQLATYAGWRLRGIAGGLLAGSLFILPGALVIAALVWLYVSFGTLPAVQAAFLGIKAAVVVIVLQALWRISRKALKTAAAWALALGGFVAIFALDLPFPLVVLGAGVIGLIGRTAPQDDLAPHLSVPANHWRTIVIWAGLWLLPLLALSLSGATFLATIGWFFAKLAVVTFGGAYAVLAYMTQTVVTTHGWITTGQMIDALGLAETTPGPLVLVTQFIAMLAGAQTGGAATALAAGAVALWATFAPCFLWIFAAAPYVERLTHHPRLRSALNAITAAVAGMMLNLSVWFLLHLLFRTLDEIQLGPIGLPAPALQSLDPRAVALALMAPVLAIALRGRILWLLAAMACLGLIADSFTLG